MKYNVNVKVEQLKFKIKRYVIGAGVAVVLLTGFSIPVFALGGANQASSCGAVHGAFNYQNETYGSNSGPGNGAKGDSSGFGTGGGSPAYHSGAIGQQPGAAGYNNSHTSCQL